MMRAKESGVFEVISKAEPRVGVSRRTMLMGGTVLATAAAMPGLAQAAVGLLQGKRHPGRHREEHSGKYLCDEVHRRIALQLDAIIADPAIDGEGTAKALMEARCPGCGERVLPATSSLSAVVPKWQWQKPGA